MTSGEWQRLDSRMMLVGPVETLGRFAVPAALALVGIGTTGPGLGPTALALAVVGVVLGGVLPWLTTYYRISETQFQVRRGLLARNVVTTPLDRVRSVDLESPLLHRLLSLSRVRIGTGVDEARILLPAVSVADAARLRSVLLGRPAAVGAPAGEQTGEPAEAAADAAEAEVLARLDLAWVRFAPFNLGRLVAVAGALGVLSQVELPDVDSRTADRAWTQALELGLVVLVVLLAVGALVAWVLLSVAAYLLRWWDYRLTRDRAHLRVTAGLLTTRSTAVEEARVRGVRFDEPALLRLVGGADLVALATGVGAGGTTRLLPPCPREVALGIGDQALGIDDEFRDTDEPLRIELLEHGPAARRRGHVRGQFRTVVVAAGAAIAHIVLAPPGVLLVIVVIAVAAMSAILAELEYRQLGHARTSDHLVSATGALARRRTVLEIDGVIGWVLRQSWFQRRVGLATLVATTAAGSEYVAVRDLPYDDALSLAASCTPEVLAPFLAPGHAPFE